MIFTIDFLLPFIVIILLMIVARTGVLNPILPVGSYNHRTAVFYDNNGSEKGELNLRNADTIIKSYVGLSKDKSLEDNSGLLLEYNTVVSGSVGMRNMKFDIDVIYINSDNEVESIHELKEPKSKFEYYILYDSVIDQGKYVIETNSGWADEMGIEKGDKVEID